MAVVYADVHFLFFALRICLVQCSFQTTSKFLRLIDSPEMQEEQAGRFKKHVTVNGSNSDAIFSESVDYRIHFASKKNKVACRSSLLSNQLEIECNCHSHEWRNLHAVFSYRLGSWNAKLQNVPLVHTRSSKN